MKINQCTNFSITWLFIIVTFLTRMVRSEIECYECTVHPPERYLNKTTKLCSKFDLSDHFKVHCPYSTFCMKKSFQLELPGGKIVKGAVRGCAPQKYDYQVLRDGKWHAESKILYDAYKSGCLSGDDDDKLRTSDTEFCYCDKNLCNKANQPVNNLSNHSDTIAVIIIYNIMRFLKTHTQPAM
ncbi:uncharacterized protein LOC126894349 isoform X2 [Daktulosphaira vitifoliae]|uniref:uncharacterized protein LOC126894349 isoform X2 n=2 Tax=Daktulosphaira vitifoliae TaxID=58002 RepID=UPI0021A9DB36|nr:uncharacterized protein LOC126894349 isoform X2 [Daktulosphaira vitifoliae]